MAQRISGTTDIGTSKTQSLMNLKADLRGWRLNGVESLKPVDPLFSEGISKPAHTDSSSFLNQNASHSRDEVFDSAYHYAGNGSVVPNWMEGTKQNPGFNKSKVTTPRDTEKVKTLTKWPGGEPQQGYLTGSAPYTFASDFQLETLPKILEKEPTATVRLGKSATVSLPRDRMGKLLYQTKLLTHGHPGGQESKELVYDSKFEEALGLIPFCITTITPDHRTYINFPAYLDSYDDNYNGNWDAVQYVGRAENFYGYTGFTRDINLSFKVAIFRREDLEEMYHRLNRLVGATAPSYGEEGLFMRGTLASLTIGDLLRHKPGFIRSVRLSWDVDTMWEVGEVEGSNIPAGPYRVPFALSVSMQFTPIEEKKVTEDNGDYFVFLTEEPVSPPQTARQSEQAPKQEQEAPPETRAQLTPPVTPPFVPAPQVDNTSVALRGTGTTISGGGRLTVDQIAQKDSLKNPNAPIPEWRKQLGLKYGQ